MNMPLLTSQWMKSFLLLMLFGIAAFDAISSDQPRTVHVFVALCDNVNQGIIPVPAALGNGRDPRNNLYWGAAFGIKNFFKNKTKDWVYQSQLTSNNPAILERIIFKHATENVYLLADAYAGDEIKAATIDFLKASNRQDAERISLDSQTLGFGGDADLVTYIGHDGLMEFSVDIEYKAVSEPADAIILACASQDYFEFEIHDSGAHPLLWTTNLMAPEAYTLKWALDGWIEGKSGEEVVELAAQGYNTYQKCGLKGARSLFTTGFTEGY